jgi:hypothetical protein
MRKILNTDARQGGDYTLNIGCDKLIMDTGIAAGFQTGYLLKKICPTHVIPVEVYMSLTVLILCFSYKGTKAPIPTGQDYSHQKNCPFDSLPELYG